MSDKEFLMFIYNRLHNVHLEPDNIDFMLRLREIIDTIPVGIRTEKKSNKRIKCIVNGCTNHSDEGLFRLESMCAPCYSMLASGIPSMPSHNFIHKLWLENNRLMKIIDNALRITIWK